MIEAARIGPSSRVFEIGAGAGYAAIKQSIPQPLPQTSPNPLQQR